MTTRARRLLRRLDDWQGRHTPVAIGVAVAKKFGEDRGTFLAAAITFYGFLAVFPLLLLFFTLVTLVVGSHTTAEKELVNSALSQFPVVGTQLERNIRAIDNGEPALLAISALSFVAGIFGIVNSLQQASADLWGVPRSRAPSLRLRLLRGLVLLGVLALAIVLGSVVTGASTIGAQFFGNNSVVQRVGAGLAGLVINVGAYLAVFRALDDGGVPARRLLPGALLGGGGWTVLQALGGYLIGHQLQRTSELYGFFAIVLGLVFWLSIGTHLYLVATELNVVRVRRLWPRRLQEEPTASEPGTGEGPDGPQRTADTTAPDLGH